MFNPPEISEAGITYSAKILRGGAALVLPTQDELPTEDGIPMESERHRMQMELLINTLRPYLQTRKSGYVSGNMFVYFSQRQLRNEYFRGPDVFVVLNATPECRKSWVVWDEGQAPDIIIELLSESTAEKDKTVKKQVYQNQLRTSEYYWFDPFKPEEFAGFELLRGVYYPIPFDSRHRLISSGLNLALVRWHGVYQGEEATWLRWATVEGGLLPTAEENAEQARQETHTAQAEVERLQALLHAHGIKS